MHETADVATVHAKLKELEPQFDPSYSTIKDLDKMPVIKALLNDRDHCVNSTYMFELRSCRKPGCKFGCQEWTQAEEDSAEAAFQAAVEKLVPLPIMEGDHYMPYARACQLEETDERDLSTAKAKAHQPKEVLKAKKKLDLAKPSGIFVGSKIRAVVYCDECLKPRLIYSMTAAYDKERRMAFDKKLDALDIYCEEVQYQCGDALFAKDDDSPMTKMLAETFFVKQIHTCHDVVEKLYFNFTNVQGRTEFELVCSHCGLSHEKSPLLPSTCGGGDVTGYSGFAMTEGRIVLPLCKVL